jgi:N-acylglucosamine-6-phosphate 2-epimerase
MNLNGIIISCQAEGNDPFNNPLGMSLFARAAELGGAVAIRSEGIEKTEAIKNSVSIPVIGLIKNYYDDGFVRITRLENEVYQLLEIGVDVIAIDGTNRKTEGFETGAHFIDFIKRKYNCYILADISNTDEAISCEIAGADFVSTTLNGYTPKTFRKGLKKPNFNLVKKIIDAVNIPVFAEGRVTTNTEVKKFKNLGVHGIVVGTAVTRPRIITQGLVKSFN